MRVKTRCRPTSRHSDSEARILEDLDRLAAVMADEKFVTARHTTQAFWKVALGGDEQHAASVTALARRFRACSEEKNGALVRTDQMSYPAPTPGTGLR